MYRTIALSFSHLVSLSVDLFHYICFPVSLRYGCSLCLKLCLSISRSITQNFSFYFIEISLYITISHKLSLSCITLLHLFACLQLSICFHLSCCLYISVCLSLIHLREYLSACICFTLVSVSLSNFLPVFL